MVILVTAIVLLLCCISLLTSLLLKQKKTQQNFKAELQEAKLSIQAKDKTLQEQKERLSSLKEEINSLAQYKGIIEVDKLIKEKKQAFIKERDQFIEKAQKQVADSKRLIKNQKLQAQKEIETLQNTAQKKVDVLKQEAIRIESELETTRKTAMAEIRERQTEANKKREETFKASTAEAAQIVAAAEQQAEATAGDALKAVREERQLRKAIQSMKNIIKGYGNQYIIPGYTLLDELADQYDYKEAGQQLKQVREKIKLMIKTDMAATCEYVEANRNHYATTFVLDAFNGKVDSILSKVKHDNYGKLDQQIRDAYHLVNQNGTAFRNAQITPEYFAARLEELKWAVAAHELLLQDREEQKRIKQEIAEQKRAEKEYQKAIKEAEKEEKLLKKAMEKARAELLSASEAQREKYEQQLLDLEGKLKEAEEKNQRALSMAQQTKRGHVYVISNHGSFGDNILKIGLTRRLEPMDRVKELGDASVPFPFDVHALMHCEDAPALENTLHKTFSDRRVNKVNHRKEFFEVGIADVKEITKTLGIETKWTMKAEAREFRESLAIANPDEFEEAEVLEELAN